MARPARTRSSSSAAWLADLFPGSIGSDPREFTYLNGDVFFLAWHPAHGQAVMRWR
ncbi:MAG: hypothetical protein NXI31_17640 [bacterium]|nr:hypothetical protein [bacterium]